MNKGYILCSAVLYKNKDETTDSKIKTAKNMSKNQLRLRLCDAGPGRCAACMLCEYGKEYVKRSQHHG